jgi:putative ABC transport system substrate-binding protein
MTKDLAELRPKVLQCPQRIEPLQVALRWCLQPHEILIENSGRGVRERSFSSRSRRQPGGNITGFTTDEATLGGKWLELLTEIAPGLKRAAIMFNPDIANASIFT